ncbi:MAG TPA: hypothetical protein VE033_17895 [Acetobacteraceae bacterium]|jgi:hypothetical protein|nr:hypothetical protein [Acetobacteraceae bacterium]
MSLMEIAGRDNRHLPCQAGRVLWSPSASATAAEASGVATLGERGFRFVVGSTPGFAWFAPCEMAQRLRATNAAV